MINHAINLVQPELLQPHEEFSRVRAIGLALKILATQTFTTPLLVDKDSKVILDGHHRWWASRAIGLTHIPCMLVEYQTDESITLAGRRAEIPVSKPAVIAMGLSDSVFPYKTTRHTFHQPHTNYKVKDLR